MGLKSGSRDAGLDEEERENNEENTPRKSGDTTSVAEADETPVDDEAPKPTSSQTESTRPTIESIPYKLRRDRVNEGREQVPFFLREKVIDAENELQDSLEAMLGEDVYKSDYREAAMIVAQRNPELLAEVLREWGYDLDTN
jgi:hypothetical protein